jgi:hypothetical protein
MRKAAEWHAGGGGRCLGGGIILKIKGENILKFRPVYVLNLASKP